MMMSRVWKLVSLVMALVFPLTMMAGSPAAMAVPTGTVTVNGSAVTHPAAIFAGDRIETAAGSVAMTLSGSSVQIAPRSLAVLGSNQVQLSGGGARILTTAGLAGQVRNLSVRPANAGKSVYTVAERDGRILVAALEGNLTLNDGHGQVMLAANHALAIPVQDSQSAPTCKPGDKKCEKAVKACKGDKNCEAQAASAAAGGAAAGGAAGGAAAAGAGAGAAAAGATVSTAVAVGVAAAAAAASAGISYGVAVATSPSTSKP